MRSVRWEGSPQWRRCCLSQSTESSNELHAPTETRDARAWANCSSANRSARYSGSALLRRAANHTAAVGKTSHCASGASPTGVPRTRGMSSEYAQVPRLRFTSSLKDVYARPTGRRGAPRPRREGKTQTPRPAKPARGPTKAGHRHGTGEEDQNVAHGAMKPEPDDIVHGFRRILIKRSLEPLPVAIQEKTCQPEPSQSPKG